MIEARLPECPHCRDLHVDVLIGNGVTDQLGHIGGVRHRERLNHGTARPRVGAL